MMHSRAGRGMGVVEAVVAVGFRVGSVDVVAAGSSVISADPSSGLGVRGLQRPGRVVLP